MIAIEQVSHVYRAQGRTVVSLTRALDGVNLRVAEREFVAFVGPSGSGKTTLLRAVAGFLVPSEGRVTVDGVPVDRPGPDRVMISSEEGSGPGARWRRT